jgi:hypothetical protein
LHDRLPGKPAGLPTSSQAWTARITGGGNKQQSGSERRKSAALRLPGAASVSHRIAKLEAARSCPVSIMCLRVNRILFTHFGKLRADEFHELAQAKNGIFIYIWLSSTVS